MANALEAASLVMIPSGYEDGTLGSLKPTDGSGDFTFSRGSNLSATRINEQGYIEKGYENLLLQSNTFDTTWIARDATITGGQSGYDGSTDAWLLEATSNGYNRRVYQAVSLSGVFTYSFYAKANTSTYAQAIIFNSAGADPKTYFNLSTGETETTTDSIDTNMVDAGNGWYRCSITGNASVTQIWLVVSDFGFTNLVDAGGSIYIQDAMLNQGLVAYPYIETTTAPVAGGILEDMPRLDYSNGSCPALLLEPSRTQLFEQSEYFGGWAANLSGISSIESNYAISPEGLQNAYKINFVVQSDSDLALVEGHSVTGGSTYAYSIYIKGEGSDIGKDIVIKSKRSGGDSAGTTTFQTLTGEWKRIDFTTTYAANNTAANFYISSNDATSCLVYGAMAEQGSYPTSYIPTYGVSQTRLEDLATDSGDVNTFNSTEGVFYFEGNAFVSDPSAEGQIYIYNDSGLELISIRFNRISANNIFVGMAGTTGASGFIQNNSVDLTNTFKLALKYSVGSWKLYVNGNLLGTTNATTFAANSLNSLNLSSSLGTIPFIGNVNQTLLFPTALTDSECIALTTI